MADEERADTTGAVVQDVIRSDAVAIVPSSKPAIRDLIYTVRGLQVMLDSDLAMLYGVETGALNRAAKRNEDRFPDDFRFQLTKEENDNLICQSGTSSFEGQHGGRRKLPYAYTEQGVAMLAGVLRSNVAIQASVRIMRAFVEMRHFIASNAAMFEQIRAVELRQLEYQRTMYTFRHRRTCTVYKKTSVTVHDAEDSMTKSVHVEDLM